MLIRKEHGRSHGIGRYVYADGRVEEGQFQKSVLVDGVQSSPTGAKTTVGNGSPVVVETYTPSAKLAGAPADPFSGLPFDNSIKRDGTGAQSVVLFVDLDGYSRKAITELASMPDITVYTFLVPILGGGPQWESLRTRLWCSDRRYEALSEWAMNGTAPSAPVKPGCSFPSESMTLLAQRYRVTGTPALLLPNGAFIPGYVTQAQVRAELSKSREGVIATQK